LGPGKRRIRKTEDIYLYSKNHLRGEDKTKKTELGVKPRKDPIINTISKKGKKKASN